MSAEVKVGPIWILWFQGWDKAPPVCQHVRESWIRHNPDWELKSLEESYFSSWSFNSGISDQARSDLVRLNLLSDFGGVWADATCACMRSLDAWLPEYLEVADFWMYHGRDGGRGPCSWFMASKKDSYIATTWRDAAMRHWEGGFSVSPLGYFWMDALFSKLLESDERFAAEWAKVPYLWCEGLGSSHMLAGITDNDDPGLQEILRAAPPHVVKLSHYSQQGGDPFGPNAQVAVGIR